MRKQFLLFALMTTFFTPILSADENAHVVVAPVTDVRSEPQVVPSTAAASRPYEMDPLEETQLLYGEVVNVLEAQGEWARVESIEQPEYTHNKKWEGYPGWVLKKDLALVPKGYKPDAVITARYAAMYEGPSREGPSVSIPLGARLSVLMRDKRWTRIEKPEGGNGWIRSADIRFLADSPKEAKDLRRSIVKTAKLFLKEPYYWGGRSGHRKEDMTVPSGVDCSGLVGLAYRVNGVDVPRDSHEQFMKARPVSYAEMKPGDLIFLAKTQKPDRVVHVMIFIGGDRAIEAVHEFNVVRVITVKNKLGKRLKDIGPEEAVSDRFVHLGRLLP